MILLVGVFRYCVGSGVVDTVSGVRFRVLVLVGSILRRFFFVVVDVVVILRRCPDCPYLSVMGVSG